MRFGSVCSGIEAASVAWGSLGWRAAWLAEIEKFPSAVLAHHYPDVPNLGDMTKLPERIRSGEIEAPDVFCGGTPCQAFSVAGMRRSLDDARGNLSLTFCTIADEIDSIRSVRGEKPCIVFWENVPGVLSTKDNAFGCFLAGLAGEELPLLPPGGKWTNAGAVFGPARTVAWRVTDAQYFGVAQRRRRVFVVARARTGFDPCAVLFEFDGVRRDTAPSREAGQGAADVSGAGATFGCQGIGAYATSATSATSATLLKTGQDLGPGCEALVSAYGGNNTNGPIDVATARNACASASGRMDFESETFLVQAAECITGAITHTLKADGFDASEDGTGRGTPMVAALPFDTTQITSATNRCQPKAGDPCHPLAAGAHAPAIAFKTNQTGANGANLSEERTHSLSSQEQAPTIAFSAKDYGADAGPLAPTLRSMGHDGSHANGGGQVAVCFTDMRGDERGSGIKVTGDVSNTLHCAKGLSEQQAVAFQERGRDDGRSLEIGGDVAYALTAPNGGGRAQERNVLSPTMQVRRLTPMECCRLQGFPDDYLSQVTWRGKCPPPDGPMYKALGNSWAVPNVAWIGRRIVAELERGDEA